MHEEREAGKKIIEALEAIDHWDALVKLDAMYLKLDKENKELIRASEKIVAEMNGQSDDIKRMSNSINALRTIAVDIAKELSIAMQQNSAFDRLYGVNRAISRLLAINTNYAKVGRKKVAEPEYREYPDAEYDGFEDGDDSYSPDDSGDFSDEWSF